MPRPRLVKTLALALAAVVFASFAQASPPTIPVTAISTSGVPQSSTHPQAAAQRLSSRVVTDGKHKFTLTELLNLSGEYEVRVDLHEEHTLAPTTHRTILIGRAIDVPAALGSNRRVTTWFIPSAMEVFAPIEFTQGDEDPWPAARDLIETHINTKNRWLAWVAFEAVASEISMAVAHDLDFFEKIKQEQLELYDLEIRLKHIEATSPSDPTLEIGREILAKGWNSIVERINNEKTRDYWMWGAGDVVLGAVALKAVSFAGRFLGVAGEKISESALGRVAARKYEEFSSKVSEKARALMPAGVKTSNREMVGEITRLGLVRLTVQEQTVAMIGFMESHSALTRMVSKALVGVVKAAREGVLQFKYIALAQSMQIFAEIAARPQDLFDVNPIIMTKKIASDKEFVHDVAYMTNETFWMAGVSNLFASDLKKRIAICGAIGMVDSMTMSLLIKGETNASRLALDTAWETVVGNLQTQIDVGALRYFESMAVRKNNPRLKLLGYVVAFVDQTAGYFGYARASYAVEKRAEGEADNAKTPASSAQIEETPFKEPQLKLIPVLAPM